MNASFRREVAAWLEEGRLRGRLASRAARQWEKRARPVRSLRLPEHARVIGVGGATLGGAGKTPVVMQLARQLRDGGARVAIVASSYRAHPPTAVRVLPHHGLHRMGDEALLMCRSLPDIPVFVGRQRELALALAARQADLVIVDSLLQTAPKRLALSILVLDGRRPWGTGACPPLGDLRARRDRLLRAADVLLVDGPLDALADVALPPARWSFQRALDSVELPDGSRLELAALQGRRLGLLTTVARPERLVERLAASGIEVATHRRGADHGGVRERKRRAVGVELSAWLTTAKCREHFGQTFENIPVWVLRERLSLPSQLLDLLFSKGGSQAENPC